jgi:hypothetical protein
VPKRPPKKHPQAKKRKEATLKELVERSHRNMLESQNLIQQMRELAIGIQEVKAKRDHSNWTSK